MKYNMRYCKLKVKLVKCSFSFLEQTPVQLVGNPLYPL